MKNSPQGKSYFFKSTPNTTFLRWCEEAQAQVNRLPNIGADRIYDNSVYAAALALTAIASRDSRTATAILLAEMQSGKTSAMIILMWVINRVFRKMFPRQNVVVGVMLLTNKSLTDIYNQTMRRLAASGFAMEAIGDFDSTQIMCLQNQDFGKVVLEHVMMSTGAFASDCTGRLKSAHERLKAAGATHFLFLMDEAQFAIQEGQQLDRFIQSVFGFSVITQPTAHFKPPALFIGVTATAHQKMVFPDCSYPIALVYCPPGLNHVGRKDIDERIIDVDGIRSAEELADMLYPFYRKAEGKVFVFRVKTSKRLNEEGIVREALGLLGMPEHAIGAYNAENRNLHEVDAFISKKDRKENAAVILKMGMGAGVTLGSVKNIGCWWDTGFSDVESMAQSIGRNMGYSRCRQEATYPIFTDKNKWDEYNRRMNDAEQGTLSPSPEVLRGVHLRKPKRKWVADGYPRYILGTWEQYYEIAQRLGYQPEDMAKSHVSENETFDLSKTLLGIQPMRTVLSRPLIPGKPKNPLFHKHWRELCRRFPEIKDPGCKKIFFVENVSHLVIQEPNPNKRYKANLMRPKSA